MGVCEVSLIISDKNPSKIFSNNSKNLGSSYTEDIISEVSLSLTLGKLKIFHGAVQSNKTVRNVFNHFGDRCF